MAAFSARVYNAAKLNVNTFEEVEHDTTALGQAFWVVVLASVAAGIGSLTEVGLGGLFVGTAAALVGWLIWAYITYYLGAKMFPQPQLKRTSGRCSGLSGLQALPASCASWE